MSHIIEIAIWKLVLIGLGVAGGSFIIGFVIACVLSASGRASRMEEEMERSIHFPKGVGIQGSGCIVTRAGDTIRFSCPPDKKAGGA